MCKGNQEEHGRDSRIQAIEIIMQKITKQRFKIFCKYPAGKRKRKTKQHLGIL